MHACLLLFTVACMCVCVCVCVHARSTHWNEYLNDDYWGTHFNVLILHVHTKHRSVTRHMHEYDARTSLKAGVAKHSLGTAVVISRMGDCLLNPTYSAEQWTIKEWRQMHSGTRQMGEGISFSADFTRPLIGGGLQPTDQCTLDRVTATKLIDHLHST